MKKKSFIRKTYIYLLIHLACLTAVLVTYLVYTYDSSVESVKVSSENFMELYGKDLKDKADSISSRLNELVYDGTKFALLESPKEEIRYFAKIDLKNQLQDIIQSDRYADFCVIAEHDYGTFLMAERTAMGFALKENVQRFAAEIVSVPGSRSEWRVVMLGGVPYVCRMYVWAGKCAAVFMAVDSFMGFKGIRELNSFEVFLMDREGSVYGSFGEQNISWELGEPLGKVKGGSYIEDEYSLCEGSFVVRSYTEVASFVDRLSMGGIALLGILAALLVFGAMLTRTINLEMLYPMRRLQKHMERIQKGDYEHRIDEEYRNVEFEALGNAFNSMMDEIVDLKISGYERQIALQDSELRSIRFQIRPHFFLNALTTISSLSMQGKNDEISRYIESLSKNVRYMFKSGLHTVELDEELRHVENYFEMQELKWPGSVFYFISVDEELRGWKIPQMLIHTIIENEYKYAVSVDSVLSIFINIRKVTDKETSEELLCIEIEDDGKGYPEEVLSGFSEGAPRSDDGSRVGLFAMKKMLELMYERQGLFEIMNIEPHGCRNRFLIPAEPKQEMSRPVNMKPME